MHPLHFIAPVCAWLVALAWLRCVVQAWRGLPAVPNLLSSEPAPVPLATLCAIVPARNEQADIRLCLESLVAQDLPGLKIIAVDDRSSDLTGSLMESVAAHAPDRLQVVHVNTLPSGWLGKTHAMHLAAGLATSEYLLFTDADVTFRPDSLRRAMTYVQASGADHLVLAPTTVIRRWDEAGLLGLFQLMGLWAVRPWRIADPSARDAIGIGAFNLIRRSAYEKIGGFSSLQMEIVEDLGLGRRVKRSGLRQRMVFGPGLVNLHWASGIEGLVGVLTKNMFAAARYSIALLTLGCLWLVVFYVLPFAGLLYRPVIVPSILAVVCIVAAYRMLGRVSGISSWNALFAPIAASIFVYALLRSMITTLWQGGVTWRGTFYSLAELRKQLPPLREVLLRRA